MVLRAAAPFVALAAILAAGPVARAQEVVKAVPEPPAAIRPAAAPLPETLRRRETGAAARPAPAQPLPTPPLGPAGNAKAPPPPAPVRVSADPQPTFGPGSFVAIMNAAERYRAIVEAGGFSRVPDEATRLRLGDRNAAATALARRLAASGDLAEGGHDDAAFDEPLQAALRRFQARHGLEETGLVGPRTLAELNVPASARLRQLQGSARRLIGTRFAFAERYVAVNIPSATLEAVEHGRVVRRYVAVVGKPDRPSPSVETRAVSINFNPTWTVPVSLVRKDIIPHVRKDPTYLARMKIRLFDAAGQEVDPGTIDWSTERAVNYTLRQDSGTANSLGEVRIDMPNRFAVYMHDTPSKNLFARTRRAQSSGCVRVSGVKDLVAWLLDGTPGPTSTGASTAGIPSAPPSAGPGSPGWQPADIDAVIAAGKRLDVRLTKPVPVAWVYLTGYVTPDGAVQFRDDVYGLDAQDRPEPVAGPNPLPAAEPVAANAARARAPDRDPGAPLTIDALITSSLR